MEVNVIADMSTVVSILPYEIPVHIPTVFPGTYTIPEAAEGKFSHIYVTRARTDVYIDSDRGNISRPILSEEVAQAIVNDHIKSTISVQIGFAEPGIFALSGQASPAAIAICQQLKSAREKQKNWYIKLIEEADNIWAKTNNPRAVGLLARKAARSLNLKRTWDTETMVEQSTRVQCPMCTSAVLPESIICLVCKYILNKEEYEKRKDNFAIVR